MDMFQRIDAQQLDLLKEVGNIGAGNAATALSTMLNKTIEMNVPSVNVVPFNQMTETVGGDEAVVVAIFLRIEGECPGNLFFMLPVGEATVLIQNLIGEEQVDFSNPPVSELAASAMQEVGNILAGSYLSSLSDFTKIPLQPSVPALAVDMTMAILSHGLIEISKVGDYAIVIETEIKEETAKNETKTTGHFFLLPDPESFAIIFNALGVDTDE
ncbi:chemotaxis protein CheC [Texcoconibacillus texcoconensis]|uniref:Chemotaxis protein CheC n=1 Tax=Texcoconibacillus texcoconensis TaxID=1095777 RepID=A0A840QI72_9BACI|nr:chemotaxis protein CheC [Texcoconibacillus texcoconensis]MBB5172054.1 chemotaxis protein CheC [Texcoconibacillus texcoconensis]